MPGMKLGDSQGAISTAVEFAALLPPYGAAKDDTERHGIAGTALTLDTD